MSFFASRNQQHFVDAVCACEKKQSLIVAQIRQSAMPELSNRLLDN
jgi:hypothetical protein